MWFFVLFGDLLYKLSSLVNYYFDFEKTDLLCPSFLNGVLL